MKFLYARVSTADQNLDRQLDDAANYDRVYTEKVSYHGAFFNAPFF